jgi:uncharacterized membrane protein YccC
MASQKPMRVLDRLREDRFLGVRFAVNVFFATIIVWLLLSLSTRANPIWAVASMIASSEPVVKQAVKMSRSRFINTAVGCAVGLLFVVTGEPTPWKLPFALAATVLLSAYVVRIPVMWRQAPVTAAIVIAGSLHPSRLTAPEVGLLRVEEVLLGSAVGIAVSWLMATVWPITDGGAAPEPANP